MTTSMDALLALRIIKNLATQYSSTDLYRDGVIDLSGNIKKGADISKIGIFDRLILNLRKHLEKSPGYGRYVNTANAGKLLLGVDVPGAAVSQWSASNQQFLPGIRQSMLNTIKNEDVGSTVASVGGMAEPVVRPKKTCCDKPNCSCKKIQSMKADAIIMKISRKGVV